MTIRRESVEDALENDRCGLCYSVEHFREDCTSRCVHGVLGMDPCLGCGRRYVAGKIVGRFIQPRAGGVA